MQFCGVEKINFDERLRLRPFVGVRLIT